MLTVRVRALPRHEPQTHCWSCCSLRGWGCGSWGLLALLVFSRIGLWAGHISLSEQGGSASCTGQLVRAAWQEQAPKPQGACSFEMRPVTSSHGVRSWRWQTSTSAQHRGLSLQSWQEVALSSPQTGKEGWSQERQVGRQTDRFRFNLSNIY